MPDSLDELFYDRSDPENYVQVTYTPLRYLGSGSFSSVLECMNLVTRQRVAIKVCLPV
jgi:hypothetical protein